MEIGWFKDGVLHGYGYQGNPEENKWHGGFFALLEEGIKCESEGECKRIMEAQQDPGAKNKEIDKRLKVGWVPEDIIIIIK